MRKLAIVLLLPMLLLLGRGGHAFGQTPTTGLSLTFPAGWSLVSLPAGTNLAGVLGPLYTLQAGDTRYETVQPSQGTKNGLGYWAYFPAATTVTLAAGSVMPMQVALPAGQWVMLGDPSGGSEAAVISGIDAAYYYDSRYGYISGLNCISRCTSISTGDGVWVYSAAGGTANVSLIEFPPP